MIVAASGDDDGSGPAIDADIVGAFVGLAVGEAAGDAVGVNVAEVGANVVGADVAGKKVVGAPIVEDVGARVNELVGN